MKIAHIILLISAFAAPVLLYAQEQSTAPAPAKAGSLDISESRAAVKQHEAELKLGPASRVPFEKRTGIEKHRMLSQIRASRKIDVRPVQPSDGIATGHAMVYGHIIPPPYKVEYSGNKLFINGIQVLPSLVRERDQKEHPIKTLAPGKKAIQQKAGKLILEAKKIYEEGKDKVSVDILHQKIIGMLSQHSDLIQNPVWQKETLCYATPAYGPGQCVNFGPSMFSPPEVQAQRSVLARKEELNMIESELKQGNMVCFGSENTWIPKKDVRAEVNRIMRDSSLSKDQKIEALNANVFNSYILAEDVVENYVAEEWGNK